MPVCIFTVTLTRGMIRKGAAEMLGNNGSDRYSSSLTTLDSIFWESSGKLLLEEDTTGMKGMKSFRLQAEICRVLAQALPAHSKTSSPPRRI